MRRNGRKMRGKIRGRFDLITHEILIDDSMDPNIRKGILVHELCHKQWHIKNNQHTLYGKINHWILRRNKILRYIFSLLLLPLFLMEETEGFYKGIIASKELLELYEQESNTRTRITS